jgi:repressor LexA
MKELTKRQKEVLSFIRGFIDKHSYPPTIREIGDHFSISVKGAHDHVTALKKKNVLRQEDKRSRTMELVGEGKISQNRLREIPLKGTVAAGDPIWAEENEEGTVLVNEALLKKNRNYFALKVRGDSMIGAGIMDGDTAVIEEQPTAKNGEIVVARVDEETSALKRYFKESRRVKLQSENPKYLPIYSQNVRILGRLAHILRSY